MITDPLFYRLFKTRPETCFVMLGLLPRLGRKEIQAMLQLHDIRESKAYQEAREEGEEKGKEEGLKEGIEQGIEQERQRILQEKLLAIPKMASRKLSAADIAEILVLDLEVVSRELAKNQV